jgi:hypothetical protein
MKKDQPSAPHILNTSSNLLGICFILLTSLKVLKVQNNTVIDEITTGAIFVFMTSSMLSFLSIRTRGRLSIRLEDIADYTFLSGLLLLFTTTLLIALNKLT